jgi:catechol 2,3-dioxygenase-like lactoylglutathione lyase family enzyme
MSLDIRGLAPLLQVFDMPASIHFYRDILGFEVVSTSGPGEHFDWALLRLNGVELMFNTAYESDERPRSSRCKPYGRTRRHRPLLWRVKGLKLEEPVVRKLRHEAVEYRRSGRL